MIDILGYIIVIAVFWFIIYWILGGVFFGAVAILGVIKLRRSRFSCAFTILSAAAAFGAAYSGTTYADKSIRVCLEDAGDVFGQLASVIGCGIIEQVVSAAIWFIILLAVGFLFFILSRAENQSWIDEGDDSDELDILEI